MSPRLKATSVLSAFAMLALGACADRPTPVEAPYSMQAAAVPSPNIMAVQHRHTPELMRREGILGTGIRLRAGGGQAIAVYALTPGHVAAARIPRQLDGYDVEVVVTGRIDAIDYDDPTTGQRPAPNGFSVGHYAITAGTIGARVTDGTNVFILSNNHVLANSNDASIGDAILQPGAYDGGTLADRIGTLYDFQQIQMGGPSNTMDAAIALVTDPAANLLGTTPSYAYGAPGLVPVDPALDMAVQKFGRTTGLTHGVIREVNVYTTVCYVALGQFCLQWAWFTGQLGIGDGGFSAGGDSGSLIVTDDAAKSPVGLLFAGSDTRTIANPIKPVLQRFGVSIDDGSGEEPSPDTEAPVANFTYSCRNAKCTFRDASTDNVGVSTRSWTFGDGGSSSQLNQVHAYVAIGTFAVTLTVADAAGNDDAYSRNVTCTKKGKGVTCR